MKSSFALFILMVFAGSAFAQQSLSVDWAANPVLHTVKPQFAKESAVILEDVRVHQYVKEGKDAKSNIIVNASNRRLIKVMDDKGVEMYNKIYIPLNVNTNVEEIKARTIQPDGKVVNLTGDKIFEVEEEGRRYKKFALEGVEKGSEIEYSWTVRKPLYFFGLEVFQTTTTPCQEASFTLEVPSYLQFSVKGYNGFSVSADTVIGDQRIVTGSGEDMVALNDEKYSASSPYMENVQYKLSYNLSSDKNVRMFTWNEMAKNVYSNYTDFTEKEQKAIDNFVKQINIPASAGEEDKIIALEDYIKTTVNIDDDAVSDDASKIEKIVKTRVANNEGVTKLFIGAMTKLGINYQIVYSSKRDDIQLDEELENYRLADDLIFFFPGTGNFLEPTAAAYRYPFIEPYLGDTKGLFLKGTTIGTFKTALASFDTIPLQPFEKNLTNLEVQLKFDANMDSVVLHSKQILLGYSAASYRPEFTYLDKDKKDEFTRSVIYSVSKSDNIQNIKVENSGMLDGNKNLPLNIEADITSADLVEQAGKRYLLKLGEVIGPQVEMYQEKPRQLPVMMDYPHSEDRDITFTIPDGYQIRNLSDLNINVIDKYDGEDAIGFISSYTLTGNVLKIKVHEFYKKIDYPVSRFNQFIKVINSSADFNKIILILEKK
jgi:hypothetical protein